MSYDKYGRYAYLNILEIIYLSTFIIRKNGLIIINTRFHVTYYYILYFC